MSEQDISCLNTNFLGMKLNTPVFTASGTFGYGEEFCDFVPLSLLGGVFVKGLTLNPRRGNEGVRVAETPSGMLNSIGLENPGAKVFLEEILPRIKGLFNIFVNISGSTPEEYGELANILDREEIAGIEVNISCPNVREGGIVFGTDPKAAAKVTESVKRNTKKPVIVKLSPNVTDITLIAKAVEDAGADALSVINTLLGMSIDLRTKKPRLGNVFGGLSGPCIKPAALRMVWQVTDAVKIPVIGTGGIASWQDAAEFLMAGASAVSVGTANFIDPQVTTRIIKGLSLYLQREKLSLGELVGLAKKI